MKLLLLGDVSPTKHNAHLWQAQDVATLFEDTTDLFRGNDLNFINLECTLTSSENRIQKFGPCLAAPKETAQVLARVGVHVAGLSNNHVFDFGIEGIRDTLQALDAAGVAHTGFGSNYEDARRSYIFEKNGQKVCIIAVCEHEFSYALEDRMGSRPFDEYDTPEDVRAAKEQCDRVIVIYHGGKEHCRYPSPRLQKLCRALVKSGADVVLCQHSHCVGVYENYQNGHILYGQGNFHFVEPSESEGWGDSLAVHYDTKVNEITFTPLEMTEYGIRLAKGAIADEIMTNFHARNAALATGGWQKGWQDFCEANREKYCKVIANAALPTSEERDNARFAHYLDCEAHTDVWRQLFPTYNQTNEK
ncbi:MAG: CapA family protein [Clostridia bacterium]|nr:CapA family protein [Clostridia bacterium]